MKATFEFDPLKGKWDNRSFPYTDEKGRFDDDSELVGTTGGRVFSFSTFAAQRKVEVFEFDLRYTWTKLRDLAAHRESFSALAGNDDRIYLLCGSSDYGPSARVEEYDPRTHVWNILSDLPEKRQRPAVAADDRGWLYVLGGTPARDGPQPNLVGEILP